MSRSNTDNMIFCDNCGLPCKPEYVKGFALIIKKIDGEERYFCKDKMFEGI